MHPPTHSDAAADTAAAPAYDIDAERIVLGSLMTDANLIDVVSARLGADDFYNPRNSDLYDIIVNAHESGVPTEPVALAGYLADRGALNRFEGGALFLHGCVAAVPLAAQAPYYVDRLLELAARRRLQVAGVRISQAATRPGVSSEDAAALAADLVQQIRPAAQDDDMVQLADLLDSGLDAIEHRAADPAGLPTGFADLDRLLGGLRKKQLITVAAPTGCGKSVFLADVARHLSIKRRHTVALFSLEMARDELFERIISAQAGVPYHLIRDGNLSDSDWQRVSTQLGPMSTAPMFICDRSEINVRQMQNKCRVLQAKHGLDAVIVDYTQLVEPSRRCKDEQEQISDVSRGLKIMAGSLDVPVIAAAQMNRGPDMRADKLPQLSDLRGSGSIANNSNVVMFIHRPDYYDPESPRRGEADFVVRKARSAPKDVVTVAAQLDKSRFVDMATL